MTIEQERATVHSVSPQNKSVVAELDCATEVEVRQAVDLAWQVFGSQSLELKERLARIAKLRSLIASRADEIARLISQEMGKPLSECYASEITGVLDTCKWLCRNAEGLLATTRVRLGNPLARGKRCQISYEPAGVVGVISPWNFPFSIPMMTILQAVAAGNTVVLKPSEKTSLTGLKIQELFEQVGFPEGTVTVVVGDRDTGRALSESRLSRLFLTGSVRAGQKIVEQTARRLTPLTLELGGKDAAIVLPDAPVEFTARGLVWGAFFNAGQACASIERVYVVRGPDTDALIEAIVEKTEKLRLGPPEDRRVDIGPLVDQDQLDRVARHINEAKSLGATILTGGKTPEKTQGFFYEPTVVTGVNHSMAIMQEESFGPLLPIMIVDSVEQAIELANESDFGLTASIWSASVTDAEALAPRLEVGTVYVNECIFSHAAPELPWGGRKQSGIGRSHCHFGLLDMVEIKNTNIEKARGRGPIWWFPYGRGRIRAMRGGVELLHGSMPFGKLRGMLNFLTGSLFSRRR